MFVFFLLSVVTVSLLQCLTHTCLGPLSFENRTIHAVPAQESNMCKVTIEEVQRLPSVIERFWHANTQQIAENHRRQAVDDKVLRICFASRR
jgi:hypothetical protein